MSVFFVPEDYNTVKTISQYCVVLKKQNKKTKKKLTNKNKTNIKIGNKGNENINERKGLLMSLLYFGSN